MQAVAALFDEAQHPEELLAREMAVSVGGAHFVEQLVGPEAAAERHGDEVLHQHVQRLVGRRAFLDAPGERGTSRRGRLDEFQRVRGHERDAARAPGCMTAAPRALQQARHPFRGADLQHPLDGQEVHAEVERRGGHHRLEPTFLEPELHPFARVLVDRAVMQRDEAGPVRPRFEQELVPDLGLGPGVGEDERGRGAVDLLDHRLLHLRAEVAGPREAAGLGRHQRVDDQGLVHPPLHETAVRAAEQHVHRLLEVAERGAEPPGQQAGIPAPQPGECQLHLHAALVAEQLVPFVHDDGIDATQLGARVLAGEHEAERLGRRHQCRRPMPVLAGPLAGRGVARAQTHLPAQAQGRHRALERAHRVGSQRAHRRDPQHAQAAAALGAARQLAQQCAEPHGIGLAGAGGGVQQAAVALQHRVPDGALKVERLPTLLAEPPLGGMRSIVHRRRL